MSLPGYVLVRIALNDGSGKYSFIRQDVLRGCDEHHNRIEMCRAFGLDEVACWFEFPNSIRTVEANRLVNGRVLDGYVRRGPKDTKPIGKIVVSYESERFKEHDAETDGNLRLGR